MALKCLVKLSQALMVNFFHNLNLPLHTLASVWLEQLEFFINLDSNLLIK